MQLYKPLAAVPNYKLKRCNTTLAFLVVINSGSVGCMVTMIIKLLKTVMQQYRRYWMVFMAIVYAC